MSASLVTDAILTTALGAVAAYIGATLDADSVVTGAPNYSAYGALVDLTNDLNMTQAIWTLDANKQSSLVFKDHTGTTIVTNPKTLKLVGITQAWDSGSKTLTLTVPNNTRSFVTGVSVYVSTFAFINSVITAVTGVNVTRGTALTP